MTDDLVERAAAVVRERYDGSSEAAEHAENRVLFASQASSKRRRRLPFLAIPLVAALLSSSAWGTISMEIRALLRASAAAFAAAPAPAGTAATSRQRVGATSSTAKPLGPAATSTPTPLPLVSSSAPATAGGPAPPRLGKALRVAPPASATSVLAPVAVAPPTDADVAALYRAAHRAQFAGGDQAHALALWDRYLSAAPNGSLSPEARYNRAITLIRLGRTVEAAQALEPFARGDYGSYRKPEAQALLRTFRPPAQ